MFVTAVSPLVAQEASLDYVGGAFGGSDFHLRDDHASPLIFSAWGGTPALQYIHAGEGNRQYAEASYCFALIAAPPENFRTDNWRGRIRYAYLVSAAEFGPGDRPFRLFVGGSLNSFLSRSNYYYFIKPLNGYTTAIDSWYWSTSIDAAVHLEYGIAEREFVSLQCFVPLIGNVSRPAYSPSLDYSYTENTFRMKMFGRTEFFPKNLSCDVLLSIQFPVVWRFNAGASYELYYASYDLPREVKMYMNNLRVGAFFCL